MENSKTNELHRRKEGMQTVLEVKQTWKKFSAMRKTKVQNGKYFFLNEKKKGKNC